MKHIAIYARVSSKKQDTRSQDAELKAWADGQTEPVKWYTDKATGKNFNRPGWQALWQDVLAGKVSRIVVWRLDRLGRTVAPLASILDELETRKVAFLSLRDGFDPSTPAGRLCRNVLASVAQFETEIRSERQMAGIQAAKQQMDEHGERRTRSGRIVQSWSPREGGNARKLTPEVLAALKEMVKAGKPKAEIARLLGLSRITVYRACRSE